MIKTVLSIGSTGDAFNVRNAVLAGAGYAIIPVLGFHDGLLAIRTRRFDAVVLGRRLTEVEKIALVRELKAWNRLVPVIALQDSKSIELVLQAGARIAVVDGVAAILLKLAELLTSTPVNMRR